MTDPNLELAREIFIGLAARIYLPPTNPEQKKPDPKALRDHVLPVSPRPSEAARTKRPGQGRSRGRDKAAVKLDDVDLSSVFGATKS